MNMVKRVISLPGAVVLSAFCSVSAFAADPSPHGGIDFTVLTTQIDWQSVITAILTVGGGVAVLYLAMSGAKHILSFIKRG